MDFVPALIPDVTDGNPVLWGIGVLVDVVVAVDIVAVKVEVVAGSENTLVEAIDCEEVKPESKKLVDRSVLLLLLLLGIASLGPDVSNKSFANASAASSIMSTLIATLD